MNDDPTKPTIPLNYQTPPPPPKPGEPVVPFLRGCAMSFLGFVVAIWCSTEISLGHPSGFFVAAPVVVISLILLSRAIFVYRRGRRPFAIGMIAGTLLFGLLAGICWLGNR